VPFRVRTHIGNNLIAYLALFVALGGTSYAAANLPANSVGSAQLRNHAVTPTKVSAATVRLFKGQRGPQGPKGDPGQSVTSMTLQAGDMNCANGGASFTSASGKSYACNGAPGTNGNTVLNGGGPPSSAVGAAGDSYIDTSAHAIYGPKTSTGWGAGTNLVGPKGTSGATSVVVRSFDTSVPAGAGTTFLAPCHAGETAVGGGGAFIVAGNFGDNASGEVITGSGPSQSTGGIYLTDGTAQPSAWAVSATNGTTSARTFRAFVLCASP